ncbi:hypothetical protein PGT21_002666 [Puccinia graminis f. sp. tritici]|uniref:Uncharacterized protein n=1 Tax=Puccinia graminis f. sp. tritici TaxID=56615 RepID=A0A5B0QWN1_PUCGR|nr:hypothetical protein PGT21_002666 [Puccinia graminis f. sp. tritici]
MSYQPIQATHNHQHLVPPRSRKCNLLLLTLIPIIFCLSSLSFIAFKQSHSSQPTLISSPHSTHSNSSDHHQLKSQAKQLSSDLLSWLDSVHNPLRLPYSSTSDYDPDQDNPLLNPPNDQSPHPILPLSSTHANPGNQSYTLSHSLSNRPGWTMNRTSIHSNHLPASINGSNSHGYITSPSSTDSTASCLISNHLES